MLSSQFKKTLIRTPSRQFSATQNDNFPCVFSDLRNHGFLPKQKPMLELPSEFRVVNELLDKMVYHQKDGSKGLLAKNLLRKTVDSDLPNLVNEIKKLDIKDDRIHAALFRDFSFLSAAYMHEPCHNNYVEKKEYGIGSEHIPEQLAVPMQEIANRIRYGQPLLEYAYGYALNNWQFVNDSNPNVLDYKNTDVMPPTGTKLKDHISLVRAFNGCTDEAGFVLVHVAIVTMTNRQVQATDKMFAGAAKGDREMCNQGMRDHLKVMKDMYECMSSMWHECNPKNYLNFRTFIMGIEGNDDIFPGGLLYKGVSEKKLKFRGETGAQDSIIPSVDNAFGLDYPRNELTEYLFSLRKYRPFNH